MTNRLPQLQQMLLKTPNDPFLYYAIALEYKKLGDHAEAIRHLNLTLEKDPAYVVAHLQIGQTCELAGDMESAKTAYRTGIAAATAKGDQHAAAEMQQMLDIIS